MRHMTISIVADVHADSICWGKNAFLLARTWRFEARDDVNHVSLGRQPGWILLRSGGSSASDAGHPCYL